MRRLLVGAAFTLLVALALTTSGSVKAVTVIPTIPPDGNCNDYYVDCGYEEADSGSGYVTFNASYGLCRTVWARRTRKNLAGYVVWRYNEQINFCYNGSAVTLFSRARWPSEVGWSWGFDGHIGSNCTYEDCHGRIGSYAEDAWTQGGFHACVIWICTHKYPVVYMTVYGNGAWGASTSG
jgi:hypothetical protein